LPINARIGELKISSARAIHPRIRRFKLVLYLRLMIIRTTVIMTYGNIMNIEKAVIGLPARYKIAVRARR